MSGLPRLNLGSSLEAVSRDFFPKQKVNEVAMGSYSKHKELCQVLTAFPIFFLPLILEFYTMTFLALCLDTSPLKSVSRSLPWPSEGGVPSLLLG